MSYVLFVRLVVGGPVVAVNADVDKSSCLARSRRAKNHVYCRQDVEDYEDDHGADGPDKRSQRFGKERKERIEGR